MAYPLPFKNAPGTLLLLVLFALPGGMGQAARGQGKPPTLESAITVATKILPGCLLSVLVTDEKNLTRAYSVDAEGNIHFLMTDESGENKEEWNVRVAGKTADEARDAIIESLKKYIRQPEVHVSIARLPRLRVEVFGKAYFTGTLDLPLHAHLSDALIACASKPEADLSKILIRRGEKGDPKTPASALHIDFTLASEEDEADDPALEAGDKIYLFERPEQPVATELKIVRIVGEVNQKEGADFPIGAGMKIKDAFARVGGLKDTADRKRIGLNRADGKYRVLDADRIEADEEDQNLPLQPGDFIYVTRKDRSLIFAVLGEVNAPNTFALENGQKTTVVAALQQGGGLTKKADTRKGILHKGYLLDPSKGQIIPFDLEKIKKGEQKNWEVEAGDAVVMEIRKKKPTIWQQLLPLALRFLPF